MSSISLFILVCGLSERTEQGRLYFGEYLFSSTSLYNFVGLNIVTVSLVFGFFPCLSTCIPEVTRNFGDWFCGVSLIERVGVEVDRFKIIGRGDFLFMCV